MKINTFRLKTILCSFFIALLLTGCGAIQPNPYSVSIDKYKSIEGYEKDQLISFVVDTVNTRRFPTKDGCILYNHKSWRTNYGYIRHDYFKNCFSSVGGKVTRTDNSICYEDYGKTQRECDYSGGRASDYVKFINKLQSSYLNKKLNKELTKYQDFKNSYNKFEKQRANKLANLKVVLVDKKNILPKNVFDKLNSFSTYEVDIDESMDIYKNLLRKNRGKVSERNLERQFKIYSKINSTKEGRYAIKLYKKSFRKEYRFFSSKLEYKIADVYFNYLPKNLKGKDKNIDFEIINTKINPDGYTLKEIKLHNRTKHFIHIDNIAGYYGDNVVNNIVKDDKKIVLAPKSTVTLDTSYKKYSINDFTNYGYAKVNNINQKINYGLSIGYRIENETIIKSLYKVNSYRIKRF